MKLATSGSTVLTTLATLVLLAQSALANAKPPLAAKEDDSTWFTILLVGGLVGGHLLVIGAVFAVMWLRESKSSKTKTPFFSASTMEELKQKKQQIGKQD